MRLVALLILSAATPAFAAPKVDVQAHLVHARDVLTKQATAICACTEQACGNKVIDEYLEWEKDLSLMDSDEYKPLVAAIGTDQTIIDQRQSIEDCNAVLRAKPWAASCQKRVA